MKKIVTLTAVVLVLVVTGVGAQSRVEMQMAAELRMLQEQTQQLALTLAQLAEALKAINARIDQTNEATKTAFATQDTRVKSITGELGTIREGTQDTNTRLGQLRDEVEAMRASIASLPALIAQAAAPAMPAVDPADPNAAPSTGVGVPPVAGAPATTTPPAPASSAFGLSPARMYNQALADYQAGRYPVAITGFESFLRQFPNVELSDDAYLYLGEAHTYQKQFEQAVTAYSQVIQNFPKGDVAPEAYYRRGLAYNQLGQIDAARASWEQLLKLYPNSTPAILAKANLERISRQQTPAKPQ